MKDYNWIINNSGLPWLKLDIEIPHEEMLAEAIALKEEYVGHRTSDSNPTTGYTHKGWKSLCIHGISSQYNNHYVQYGYKSHYKKYFRLRYMLLEPKGFITPHHDSDINKLSPINIALNHPEGCLMKMKGHDGYVPFKPGDSMLLDVGNTHAYINKSEEDRYHIIVHGVPSQEYKDLVVRSYEKNGIK